MILAINPIKLQYMHEKVGTMTSHVMYRIAQNFGGGEFI